MASFLDFRTRDYKGRPGLMRIPITTQSLPAGIATYAAGIVAAVQGTLLPTGNAIKSCNLVITGVVSPVASAVNTDSRNKWQATMIDTNGEVFRWSIPGRNMEPTLYADASVDLADLTATAWTGLQAALANTAGTIHMVNPETDVLFDFYKPVKSTTRSGKLPREGNARP